MYARLRCSGNLHLSGIRYRRGPLWYGICVPCSKRLPVYATHFQRHSVLKTGFYGTEEIFGAKNSLLWYATHLQRPAEQPTPQTVDSLLPHRTHFQRRAVPKAAPAHRTHLQCAKRPPLSLFAPAAPSLAPSTALGTRNGPRSEVSIHKKRFISSE